MMKLSDFIKSNGAEESHPRLNQWRTDINNVVAQGGSPQLRIERKADLLGYQSARIVLELLDKDGVPLRRETEEWDVDLNRALVLLGLRAVDEDNEVVRSVLTLTDSLSKVEVRFGEGYASAVFIDLVKSIDFSDYPKVGEILAFSTALAPDRTSRTFTECRGMIEAALHRLIGDLRDKLKYGESAVNTIFVDALVQFIDERFSVTTRRRLGLLR